MTFALGPGALSLAMIFFRSLGFLSSLIQTRYRNIIYRNKALNDLTIQDSIQQKFDIGKLLEFIGTDQRNSLAF